MKKILVLASLLATGATAKADIIECGFTEPFYTITYTTGTRVLTIKNDSENTSQVINKVGFLIRGAGQFELVKGGQVIMTLDLNNQGSDGMSDYTYPYEAKVLAMANGANNGIGGCESIVLKKHL